MTSCVTYATLSMYERKIGDMLCCQKINKQHRRMLWEMHKYICMLYVEEHRASETHTECKVHFKALCDLLDMLQRRYSETTM